MKINIYETVGPNCITYEDGEKIFNLIYPELKKGSSVELDFSNVRVFASPFFNSAIGRLLEDISIGTLKHNLNITNTTSTGNSVISRVIENSKDYYFNPEKRKAIDETLLRQAVNQ